MTGFQIVLLIGVALLVFGFATWRVAGKELALTGATLVALAGYILLPPEETVLRSASLAIAGGLVVAQLVRTRRKDWRRPEILLAACVVLALLASLFLENVVPREMQSALLALLVILAAAFFVLTFVHLVRGRHRSV